MLCMKQPCQFPIYQIPANKTLREGFNGNIVMPKQKDEYETFVPLSTFLVPNQLPNRYLVSNYGYIWDCYLGKQVPMRSNKPNKNTGYLKSHIAFYSDPYTITSTDVYVHRAVLLSYNFTPAYQDLQVNHIDGNSWNNRLNNLEWTTGLENCAHALEHNLYESEKMHNILRRNALSDAQVYDICFRRMQYQPIAKIAEDLKIDINAVRNVISGRTFSSISSQFNFPNIRNDKAMPDELVHKICQAMAKQEKVDNVSISKEFNIPISSISAIRIGTTYKDIRSQYPNIITNKKESV